MSDTLPPQADQIEASKDFVWVTRIGEPIPLVRMTDQHLVNTHFHIARTLTALRKENDQRACDQNILGDNPEGFTGLEGRISGMETAFGHVSNEIQRRGLEPRAAAVRDEVSA